MPSEPAAAAAEIALVREVLAGDAAAIDRFFRHTADALWSVCRHVASGELAADEAYGALCATLVAERFKRLRIFDGRSRLQTFVCLLARDLLAERLLALIRADARGGWQAFEAFFAADIDRLIRRRLPGAAHAERRRDAWQEICVGLIAEDWRRLKSFSGAGSFIGFVLQTADRLLLDYIRTFSLRRRMPAAVARLSALEQAVFRAVYWQGIVAEPAVLVRELLGRFVPAPGAEAVTAALAAVRRALPVEFGSVSGADRPISLGDEPGLAEQSAQDGARTPEEDLLGDEEERLLEAAAAVLRSAAGTLPEAEREYIRIALGGPEPIPAREVARLMRRPVAEIYKLKQRVLKTLNEAIAGHVAVRNWRASV